MDTLKQLIKQFMPFAQERMGFEHPPRLFLRSDAQNASDMLGRTAQYNPTENTVVIYVTDRHPKDILRSLSHELVHHTQNGRGDFENGCGTEPGYAQNDTHMREMEREAYESGNLCFRDWEDSIKDTIYNEHLQKGDKKMSIKEWKNEEISALLSEAWGFKFGLDELNEATPRVGYGTGGEAVEPEDKTMKKGLDEAELDEDEEIDEKTELDEDEGSKWKEGPEYKRRDKSAKHPVGKRAGVVGGHYKTGELEEDEGSKWKEGPEYKRRGKSAKHPVGKRAGDVGGHYKTGELEEDDKTQYTEGVVKEDTGEDEAWHEWKNEHADDDHIREIEHHLRALKDDRDYERHGAEYDHDKYEDEGMEEGMDERRGRGRKGPHTRTDDPRLREVMNTVAKKYPNISEERMQKLAAYAMRARK